MTSEGDIGPVWARTGRRKRRANPPIVGIIVVLLAVFGAVTIGLSIKEKSVAGAGAVLDGWISSGWNSAKGLVGKAPEAAEQAASEAGQAATDAAGAVQAGAEKAAEEVKNP